MSRLVRGARGPDRVRGQILVMYLLFLIPISLLVFSIFNVGIVVSEKMRLQNAADAAAQSAATWEARYANLVSFTNRAIVANLDMIATQVALWSMTDAWDGFTAAARDRLKLEGSKETLEGAHGQFHRWNEAFARRSVGRSTKAGPQPPSRRPEANRDGAMRLENYNEVLSRTQAALYVVTQAAREVLVREIAWSFDPRIEASLFSESLSALSLHSRVRWGGTDPTTGLKRTVERSLNPLARGKSLRDFSGPTGRSTRPYLDSGCGPVRITARGFDGPGFETEGAAEPSPEEEGGADESRILTDERTLQRDVVAASRPKGASLVGCPAVDLRELQVGHFSDDARNRLRKTQRFVPHRNDPRLPYHVGFFHKNAIDCVDDIDLEKDQKACTTSYRWLKKLSETAISTYVPSEQVEDGREVEGPTVLVVLRKPGFSVPVLVGAGLVTPDDLEAYAFAKVYYEQASPEGGERESLFNPRWRARLEAFRPLGNPLLH